MSVTQFLLREKGAALPINGYFDSRTERTVRAFQRSQGLAVDGIAGPVTLAALVDRTDRRKVRTSNGAIERVRSLLDYWARYYAVDRALVRALAWMESGYQANLTSSAGAWGVMQVLPSTWVYVETVLLGQRIPRTVSGNIRVGVAFLRELLREFNGDQRGALAAWYQGPTSFRRHGPLRTTRHFVANVVALKQRTV